MDACTNGHPIRGPQDRYKSGHCKQCHLARTRAYQAKARAALKRLRELEGNRHDHH